MKPLLVTRLVPETHVIILKHNRLPKRVRLILATRLYRARLSLPTGEGMVGEAGTQVETRHATSLLVHAEAINAQSRPHRRNAKRRGPSSFVCTKKEVHYPAMQNARKHVRWEILRSAQNDRACGRGLAHCARTPGMSRPSSQHVSPVPVTRCGQERNTSRLSLGYQPFRNGASPGRGQWCCPSRWHTSAWCARCGAPAAFAPW